MQIKKRRTDRPGAWILEMNGESVGQATEWFMSATQRRWSAEITVDSHTYTVPNTWSVKQAIKDLEFMIQQGVADPATRLAAIRARASS